MKNNALQGCRGRRILGTKEPAGRLLPHALPVTISLLRPKRIKGQVRAQDLWEFHWKVVWRPVFHVLNEFTSLSLNMYQNFITSWTLSSHTPVPILLSFTGVPPTPSKFLTILHLSWGLLLRESKMKHPYFTSHVKISWDELMT